MNRTVSAFCLPGAFLSFFLFSALALPQNPERKTLQGNQVGINTFVSGPKGDVFLILNSDLFRQTSPSGDSWDRLTGNVKAVALDPDNEKILFAISTRNTVMKSMDQGKNWLTLSTGSSNQNLAYVFVNPANAQEVFVGGASGLLKTDDAGFSWQNTSFTGPVAQVAINPLAPDVIYVLSNGGIYESSDRGVTWRRSETGLPSVLVKGAGRTATKVTTPVSLLAAVAGRKPMLLAATIGKGVFRSEDNGVTWTASGTGLDLAESFLAASVGKDQITLASSSSLFRSADGANWSRVKIASGRNTPVTFLGAIDDPLKKGLLLNFRFPQDGEIENVGLQRRIGFLDEQGVLVGLNYGVLQHSEVDGVWTAMSNGKPVLFAETFNGNDLDQVERWHRPVFLYMSTDDGYSWQLFSARTCGNLATRPAGSESEVWVYGGDSCVMRTTDAGQTWDQMPGFNAIYSGGQVTDFKFDPVHHNVAYYSTGVNERHLMRYQYNPDTKQGQSVDLKTLAVSLVVDPANPAAIFTDKAQLSTDGGWTWIDKSHALAAACKCDVTTYYVGPAKPLSFRGGDIRLLIAEGSNAFNGYPGDIVVMRSQDSGDSWNALSKLPISGLRAGPFVDPDNPDDAFVAAVFSQGTPGAFGSSYRATTVKVLETQDGGATWKEILTRAAVGQNPGVGFLHGVAQFKQNGGRSILLATSEGLLRSGDEGRTWAKLGGLRADAGSSQANPQATSSNETDARGLYRIGGRISAPKVVYSPEAEFTDEARRSHYQGTCIVGLTVDAEGNPQDVHIVRPLDHGLSEKALEAVRKYRFTRRFRTIRRLSPSQ